jgi:hypothetical protein
MHPGIVHSIIMLPFHIPVTVTVTVGRPRGIFGTQTEPGELRARASLALVCTLPVALHWHCQWQRGWYRTTVPRYQWRRARELPLSLRPVPV